MLKWKMEVLGLILLGGLLALPSVGLPDSPITVADGDTQDITTDLSTAEDAVQGGYDVTITVYNSATITATGGDGITTSYNSTVTNNGTIDADYMGVYLSGDDNSATNAADATITSDEEGICVEGDNATVVNNGDITSSDDDGIQIEGDDASVTNAGTISAYYEGIQVDGDDAVVTNSSDGSVTAGDEAIDIDGDGATITNEGTLTSTGDSGIYVDYEETGENSVTNSGSITADDSGIELYGDDSDITNTVDGTISAGYEGIYVEGDDATVTNNGSITSDEDDGISVYGDDSDVTNASGGTITADAEGINVEGDDADIDNSGTVTAGDEAIDVIGDNVTVTNSGTMTAGDDSGIDIEGDEAIITNSGTITSNDASNGGNGIELSGDDGRITNSGAISSTNYNGISVEYSETGDNTVINSGDITAGERGISLSGDHSDITNAEDGDIDSDVEGIYVEGDQATVVNHGDIDSGDEGDSENEDGISILGDDANVTHGGDIDADSEGIQVAGDDAKVKIEDEGVVDAGAEAIDVAGDGATITNSGTLTSTADDGISLDGDDGEVTNDEDGAISSYTHGINVSGDGNGIDNSGSITAEDSGIYVDDDEVGGNSVTNSGAITASDSGIEVYGDASDVTNDEGGTINATEKGIFVDGDQAVVSNDGDIASSEDDGIHILGDTADVTNGGQIVADDNGLFVSGDDAVVTNTEDGMIDSDEEGLYVDGYQATVVNDGGITSVEDDGIRVSGDNAAVTNTGTVSGGDEAIDVSGDNAAVSNSGQLTSTGDIGISVLGDDSTVTNTEDGMIDSYGSGIYISGDNNVVTNDGGITTDTSENNFNIYNYEDFTAGIYAEGDDLSITNNGDILGLVGLGLVTDGDEDVVNTVTNSESGDIMALVGIGVVSDSEEDTDNTITNDGNITSVFGIVLYGAGDIINSGSITATGLGQSSIDGGVSVLNGGVGFAIMIDCDEESDGFANTITLESGSEVIGYIVDTFFDAEDEEYDGDELILEGEGILYGGSLGVETLTKTDDGTWVLQDGGESILGGGNQELETLTDIDDGVWLLGQSDPGFIHNDVAIEGGTLQIDGTVGFYDTFTIDAGAILSGTGGIYADDEADAVMNYGTVAPGSDVDAMNITINTQDVDTTIGTLTIDGDYTQDADGTLAIEVDGEDADELIVTGTATIAGTVSVTTLGYVPNDTRYTILDAGTLIGEFDTLDIAVGDTAVLDYTLYYDEDEDNVELLVERTPYPNLARTPNQNSIATYLQGLIEDNDELAGLLDPTLTEAEFQEILDSLTPEQYAAFLDAGITSVSVLRGTLTGRMSDMRTAALNSNNATANGPVLARLEAPDRTAGGLSAWTKALGQTAQQDGDGRQEGFDSDTYGLALGADSQIGDNFIAGAGMGIMTTDIDSDRTGQSSDVDTYHVSLYGTYFTDVFYVDTALTYSNNDYTTKRYISLTGDTAKGDTSGDAYSLYVGGGYNLMAKDAGWYLTPTLSVEFVQVNVDGFTETGAGEVSLKVDDSDTSSLTSSLGAKIGTSLDMGGMRVEPEMRLAWAHEFGDADRTEKASFVGAGGTFTVEGLEPERDSALLGLGVKAQIADSLTVGLDYDGEFRSDFDSHQISANLRFNF